MSTKGWVGRQVILSIESGATESDILDLGAIESIEAVGISDTGGSTTSIITTGIVNNVNGKAVVLTTDCFKGKGVIFRPDTATAALRNQKRLISANTAAGVLTVAALTDAAAAGDVFDITDLKGTKSYRRFDIQVCSPATVTGTVNVLISNAVGGTYYKQYSGASAIVIPTATVATPIIPLIARFLKLVGTQQGQLTHFEVWGSATPF